VPSSATAGAANTAAKCANDFADDSKVAALVGVQTNFGDTVDPVIERRTSFVGQSMFGLSDFKSPMIFPADGGSISGIAAADRSASASWRARTLPRLHRLRFRAQLIPVFDSYVLKPFDTKLQTSVPIPTRQQTCPRSGAVGERQSRLHRVGRGQ
jgi:hypothetical protein